MAAATFLAVFLGGVFGPGMLKSQWVGALKVSSPRVAHAPYYPTCSSAHAAGVYSLRAGEPGYREALDRDRDGLACEPYTPR